MKNKIVKGTLWSFLEQFSGKVIGFVIQLILARLLSPDDFGLIAMVIVFIGIGTSIMDSGFGQSLIRTKKPSQVDFSSVFFINIISALVIYGVIYIIAPYVSVFYDESSLTFILRVLSLIIVIRSLSLVQQTIMTINLNFKHQTLINFISTVIAGSVAVVLAYSDFGVWALVFMQILSNLIASFLFWLYGKWRPKLIFDFQCIKEHFNFGYKLMLNTFVDSIFNNLFEIIVGKFYSSSLLGYYNRASVFQKFPTILLGRTINRVTYPMFSKVSGDKTIMKGALRKINKMVVYVYTPFMFFLIFNAEKIIIILLTEKWLPVVWIFKLLCIGAIFQPMQYYNINIVKSLGKSGLILKVNFLSRLITVLGLLFITKYGIEELILFKTINMFFISCCFVWLSGSRIDYNIFEQFKDVSVEFLISFLVSSTCFYISSFSNFSNIVSVLIYIMLFVILYLFLSFVLKIKTFTYILSLIKKDEKIF